MLFYDNEIISIDKNGIFLKNNKTTYFIDFIECAKVGEVYYSSKVKFCVGARDITKYVFKFFENDNQETHIIIKKRHVFDTSRARRFITLHKKINLLGYTTFDLS